MIDRVIDIVLSKPVGIGLLILVLSAAAYVLTLPTIDSSVSQSSKQKSSEPTTVVKPEPDAPPSETGNSQSPRTTNPTTGKMLASRPAVPIATIIDFANVSCWKYRPANDETIVVRSRDLVSPDGARVAYSQFEMKSNRGDCIYTSQLFVVSEEFATPQEVFLQEPDSDLDMNIIRIVDWSRTGQYLLAELTRAKNETDHIYEQLLVFDSNSQDIRQPKIGELFTAYTKKKYCYPRLTALGFSEELDIVVEAGMMYDRHIPEEEQTDWDKQFCSLKSLKWRVTFLGDPKLESLPDSATVQRYGRWQ